ncbi:Aldehyde dehydrogenase family 2 member C4 [Striga hermonthica]|uniref:Aldehyde dehydrogenase family 2 member C4 n=1 Tax=Striga hermonthica TaxID=68872 RepID=A0A9N7MZE1_STRHE|nr:Aldehyde dehydrogenase family 2 member C4 [Striga hermonthica]
MANGRVDTSLINYIPQLKFTKLFINGDFVDSISGKTFETIDPRNEEVLAKVSEGSNEDVDLAVKAARQAFDYGPWPRLSGSERRRIMLRLADLIDQHHEELAALDTADAANLYTLTKGAFIHGAAEVIRYYAGAADKIHGATLKLSGDKQGYTLLEPIGVVGLIIPWNFPTQMFAMKVGPALAAGCTVILKPAEQTPLSALYYAHLAKQAGVPDGVFNVVTGYGSIVGAAITSHMDVDMVSFTGSTETGHRVMQAAAASNLKHVALELGGKSPFIVFDDVDIDKIAPLALTACFFNQASNESCKYSGQICVAGTRVFIQEGIYDKFIARLLEQLKTWVVGDPFDPNVNQGPQQVDKKQYEKVLSYIDRGKKEGATLLTGGKPLDRKGYYIEPTIFTDVTDDMSIAKEEIFGPVMSIMKFKTSNSSKPLSKSKENEMPRKPFSQIPKRDASQSQNLKPICKNGRRSKLAPVESQKSDKFEKGPSEFQSKLNKNSQNNGPTSGNMTNNPSCDEKRSPVAKSINFSTVMVNFSSNEVDKENDSSCCTAVKTPPVEASLSPEIQTQSRSKIPVSKMEAKTPIFYGAGHLVSGVNDKRKCRRRGSLKGFEETNFFHENGYISIPLPAEASVRWVLSPCDEERVDFDRGWSEKASDSVCADIGSDNEANSIGHYSALSICSLSGGNIIQTPNSDSSSGKHGGLVRSEMDAATKSLNGVRMPMWEPAILRESAVNSVSSSWVSSTALDNLALSRMKISWRDGLADKILENDEFDDCCCLLSDEEADGFCSEKKIVSCLGSEEKESGDNNKDNGFRMENGLCPVFLDYEPQICGRGKEKSSSNGVNVCVAESFLTDGGSLVASSDSDWTYCRENRLFQFWSKQEGRLLQGTNK